MVGDVEPVGDGFAAKVFDGGFCGSASSFFNAVGEDDVVSAFGEMEGQAFSQAAAGSGDECDFHGAINSFWRLGGQRVFSADGRRIQLTEQSGRIGHKGTQRAQRKGNRPQITQIMDGRMFHLGFEILDFRFRTLAGGSRAEEAQGRASSPRG